MGGFFCRYGTVALAALVLFITPIGTCPDAGVVHRNEDELAFGRVETLDGITRVCLGQHVGP